MGDSAWPPLASSIAVTDYWPLSQASPSPHLSWSKSVLEQFSDLLKYAWTLFKTEGKPPICLPLAITITNINVNNDNLINNIHIFTLSFHIYICNFHILHYVTIIFMSLLFSKHYTYYKIFFRITDFSSHKKILSYGYTVIINST